MLLTVQHLRTLDACQEGRVLFRRIFGECVELDRQAFTRLLAEGKDDVLGSAIAREYIRWLFISLDLYDQSEERLRWADNDEKFIDEAYDLLRVHEDFIARCLKAIETCNDSDEAMVAILDLRAGVGIGVGVEDQHEHEERFE